MRQIQKPEIMICEKRKMRNPLGTSAAILSLIAVTAGYIINPRSSNVAGSKKHDVYIAGFFPFDEAVAESEIGRGVLPAVRLAVDHINDNPTVLRNYILHLWWNDTKVSSPASATGSWFSRFLPFLPFYFSLCDRDVFYLPLRKY